MRKSHVYELFADKEEFQRLTFFGEHIRLIFSWCHLLAVSFALFLRSHKLGNVDCIHLTQKQPAIRPALGLTHRIQTATGSVLHSHPSCYLPISIPATSSIHRRVESPAATWPQQMREVVCFPLWSKVVAQIAVSSQSGLEIGENWMWNASSVRCWWQVLQLCFWHFPPTITWQGVPRQELVV